MLCQEQPRPLFWPDQTMSVLKSDRLKACGKLLSEVPAVGLFDSECSDKDAEALFALSYFAMEEPARSRRGAAARLHTLESLRARVLSSLAAEMALLSPDEHDLWVRSVLFGGRHYLSDPETLRPALSLVRRLWCGVRQENGQLVLTVPPQLRTASLLILAGEGHRKVREIVQQVFDRIDTSLYLLGVISPSSPEQHLAGLLAKTHADGRPDLIRRFLHACCEFAYDRDGRAYLVHPGLAEPARCLPLLAGSPKNPPGFLSMDEQALSAASDSLADLEDPLYERLLCLTLDVTRPEYDAEDVAEDLFILAKQSASLEAMEEVLAASLICLPTKEMRLALRDLYSQVPRWFFLASGVLQ